MRILGLEKLSLVDFEGYTSAVVFTGGCNFFCPFCHNSGLVKNEISEISESEVLNYLTKRFRLLDAVCISGGEPTLQEDLPLFIKRVKEIGYRVKLDTNGTNPKMLKELIESNLIDYVAMDIKNCFDKYTRTAGVKSCDMDNIKQSIDILKQGNIDYEFRTTLVAELHDLSSIEMMKEELRGSKRLYLQRFVDNDNCISHGLTAVDKSLAESYRDILKESISEVKLRGYV